MLVAAPAFADDAVVKLKNGDMARGLLMELTQGDHVTIQVSSGEIRTYAWSEIDSVAPVTPSLPPPPAPALVQPLPPPPPREPEGALVHIVTDDEDARLSKLAGTDETSERVGTTIISLQVDVYDSLCRAPCDKRIRPGFYRITGRDLNATDDFEVPAAGAISIDAHMRSRTRARMGKSVLVSGISLLVGGGAAFVLSALFTNTGNTSSFRPLLYGIGGAMIGLGAIGMTLGIYFLATAHSQVEVTQANTVQSFVYRGMTLTF